MGGGGGLKEIAEKENKGYVVKNMFPRISWENYSSNAYLKNTYLKNYSLYTIHHTHAYKVLHVLDTFFAHKLGNVTPEILNCALP
jgi:hypothetical protein